MQSLWLVNALQYIDFDKRIFLQEVLNIEKATTMFKYSDLCNMDFKDYQELWNILKERENEAGKENG